MSKSNYNLLVKSSKVISQSISAAQFLLDFPRGGYTTARTFQQQAIFEFPFHIQRLADTARLMLEKEHHPIQCDASTSTATPSTTSTSTSSTSSTCTSSTCTSSTSSTSSLHSIVSSPTLLKPYVVKSLQTAFKEYRQIYPEIVTDQHMEFKVTMLLAWQHAAANQQSDNSEQINNEPFDIYVHLCPLPSIPVPPIKVMIRKADRKQYSTAKDSQWVRDRQTLEETKPKDVNEIILMDENGALLEGMSSNFGVVIGDGSDQSPFMLQTAEEDILKGTVRDLLLHVCEELHVPVLLKAPNVKESATWTAAFVSSTSRLVLPIDELYSPESPIQLAPDTVSVTPLDKLVQFTSIEPELQMKPNPIPLVRPHPLLDQLMKRVMERIESASERIPTL